MHRITESIDLKLPAEDVFAFLKDIESRLRLNPFYRVLSFFMIYFESGHASVVTYAQGLIIMLFPLLAYIFAIIFLITNKQNRINPLAYHRFSPLSPARLFNNHNEDMRVNLPMLEEKIYDCIIIGAGPGGLQAAIYLGRYNRDVLLLDRGGGRTRHARHIENFLTQKAISGKEIIEIGIEQAENFNVKVENATVTKVLKNGFFEVYAGEKKYLTRFVIVSSGVYDNLPDIENLHKFLGISIFTCIDCDGYKTTNKKLIIIGNSLKTMHLAFAMKEMFTKDITLILYMDKVPDEYKEELREQNIPLIIGRPVRIIGDEKMSALELKDGQRIGCEVIMSHFGYKLNDAFLSELDLKRDNNDFKFIVKSL